MPDTLFLLLISIFLLVILLYLPYIIWFCIGGINLTTFILGRHQFPKPPKKVIIAKQILQNYKESFIVFSPISVLSIIMGIPIQIEILYGSSKKLKNL